MPDPLHYFIIGQRYKKKLAERLNQLNVNVIWMPDNPNLAEPVRGHADLSVLKLADESLILAPYLAFSNFSQELSDAGIHYRYADIKQSAEYPYDVQLSICQFNNYLLCNPKTVEPALIKEKYSDCTIIPCKQGYTRCSVFKCNERAAITADTEIYKKLQKCDIDVLLIESGSIYLPGYNTGFIGGSGFMLNATTAAFSGSLNLLPDHESIILFLLKYNIGVEALTMNPVFDFGGAIDAVSMKRP